MARTSAKAKKSKQEVNKKKEEAKQQEETQTSNESSSDSTDKENDSSNQEVEKITHTRIFKGKRQYLVRWKGYTEDGDTWENESALQSCKEVLESFKKEYLTAVSDDESTEEEVTQKSKSKGKMAKVKAAEKVKKNTQKSGRLSKIEVETDLKPDEEENKEIKQNNKDKSVKGIGGSYGGKNKIKEAKSRKRNATKETEISKAKKAKKVESDDESVTDGKDYEVDKIIEVHTRKDGSREFLVRWKGYKPSDDTWEPEAHLDCQQLIDKFMEKVEKAKDLSQKELRENRKQTKRFVPLNTRPVQGSRSQRNRGVRPCYQETYED